MRIIRRAEADDLAALLKLYLHLNPTMPRLTDSVAQAIWRETLSRKGVSVFIASVESQVVATCLLATVPNLMRGGSPYGFVENVVTHASYRRQGHGRAIIEHALGAAWDEGCQQVMLQTGRGRTDPGVLAFYDSCGFHRGFKTAFVALRASKP